MNTQDATEPRPLSFAEQIARISRLRIALAELGELHRAAWDKHLRETAESFVNWDRCPDPHR